MNEYPQSVSEWMSYVRTLEGADLRSKTIAMNTYRFVRVLMDEGHHLKDIEMIFIAVALRYQELGEAPPGGGTYDLSRLLKENQ